MPRMRPRIRHATDQDAHHLGGSVRTLGFRLPGFDVDRGAAQS
jgi:hypothetical protein